LAVFSIFIDQHHDLPVWGQEIAIASEPFRQFVQQIGFAQVGVDAKGNAATADLRNQILQGSLGRRPNPPLNSPNSGVI